MNLKENNIRPFQTTAGYYSRFRLPYDAEAFGVLVEKFSLNKESRVLDLGAGTGHVALPLSRYVGEIVALDAEGEMIAEGKRIAQEKGITNIIWKEGFAEDIDGELGMFNLVTIGTTFHWMDQNVVLPRILDVTKSGGGIALLNNLMDGPWKQTITNLRKEYYGEKRPAGTGFYVRPEGKFEDVLAEAGFFDVEIIQIPFEEKRTVDEIVGEVFSMSYASPFVLSEEKDVFEQKLRSRLEEHYDEGVVVVEGVTEVMIGFKK